MRRFFRQRGQDANPALFDSFILLTIFSEEAETVPGPLSCLFRNLRSFRKGQEFSAFHISRQIVAEDGGS